MKKAITGLFIICLSFQLSQAQSDSVNLEHKPFQFTFLFPPLSTNGVDNFKTINDVSLNLFIGVSGGVESFEAGGFINVDRYNVNGAQFAGFGNTVGGHLSAAQFAGFYNVVGASVNGFQGAGFINIAGEKLDGFQGAGFMNVAGSAEHGVQAAGFGNVSGGGSNQFQAAGFINVADNVKEPSWQDL